MRLNCNSFFDGDFSYLNLNAFYLENRHLITDSKDPSQIQSALSVLNKNTYGGYAEDRKDIWKGTYMDKTQAYIHLGIDINVPSGTPIKCPFDGVVIEAFTDLDTKIGWGGRLILVQRSDTQLKMPFLVLGHLNPGNLINAASKKYFNKGEVLGHVGTWPTNGNTFNHLHVQCITKNLLNTDFDGYGFKSDLENNPDPFGIDFSAN